MEAIMFGFPKREIIDQSTADQTRQVKELYGGTPMGDQSVQEILEGLDCDEIPGAFGPFGSVTNPIPVNGSRGELMYLKRLRCECSLHLFFHRLGSTTVARGDSEALDAFETVCVAGRHWHVFYLYMAS